MIAEKIKRLAAMKNVGEKTAGWMIEVGVDSPERLAEIGAVEAYRRMKAAYPRQISLCAVWALEGALHGVHYSKLDPDHKLSLKAAVAEVK